MARLFPLEKFTHHGEPIARDTPPPISLSAEISPEELEKQRLEGYEAGYKAGWDDAIRAEEEEQKRIGAEFARNLQDMGFTFHEARAHVMNRLEPLLLGMIEKVLPELVSQTIGHSIVEELLPLASDAADTPIEVVVHPSCRTQLEPLLASTTAIPITLTEEPSLAEGQVYLRAGSQEKHLDFTGALERMGKSITDLFSLNERAFQNGQT